MLSHGGVVIVRAVASVTAAAVVAGGLLLGEPVQAAVGGGVDLRDGADVVIVGEGERDMAGFVSNAGDVNGDKVPDVLVTSCEWPHLLVRSGATYVVFGVAGKRRTVQLDDNDSDYGFRIDGGGPKDYACDAEGAGDVNGDGLDDIVIGAIGADNRGRTNSGSAYVVFGKRSTTPVTLALFDLGLQQDLGFRIDGAKPESRTGDAVDGAGDMNGDGLHDILLGAPAIASSYVVFGKTSTEPVDLRQFHNGKVEGGIQITHRFTNRSRLFEVAGIGDANGDRIPDVAIGVAARNWHRGLAYVVYGRRSAAGIDARRFGKGGSDEGGFKIVGARRGDDLGRGLGAAGDVNGDGFADLIVGAARVFAKGRGSAYVVFGGPRARRLELPQLGPRGFRIRGLHSHDIAGLSVAGAGDVNGDGLDDLIVGVQGARFSDRGSPAYMDAPGGAFVVYGKHSRRMVRLDALGADGYWVKGAEAAPKECDEGISHPSTGVIIGYYCSGDMAGQSVAPAGDVNRDGLADILVGAPHAGDPYPGHSYIIWSHPFLRRR